ncbi:MAG: lyase [Nitrosopumilaceae archaeon]
MKKSLYFIVGFAILIASSIVITFYDESLEGKEEISKTTIEPEEYVEITGTPADNYAPKERDQHCGNSDAKSNHYILEFEVPTPCAQPLSIITDSDGNIWFAQTNTGNLAMFDPVSEEFIEYQNEMWSSDRATMMWGIFYTPDDEIWFTDEANDFLWKFSIPEKKYSKFDFPGKKENSFPQKIEFHNDNFLINDFTGNQIVVVSHDDLDNGRKTFSTISVPEGFFTSQASIDSDENIWFVMWKYQKEALLTKTNSVSKEIEQFSLPNNISAPNGVSVGPSGGVWIADTASSSFFKFNPENLQVIEFVTSDPPVWTFGNSSGLIKTPITRPYWNDFDSDGNMWFNQQTGNRLAVFDPVSESLIEYDIPSKNPGWADCGDLTDCGVSQVFGFTIQNEKVWFTEWVENNIGVLDTSITIPVSLDIEQETIQIKQGDQKEIFVKVKPNTNNKIDLVLSGKTNSDLIEIKTKSEPTFISDQVIKIPVTISIDNNAHPGYYKILLGTQMQDVFISSYATIQII